MPHLVAAPKEANLSHADDESSGIHPDKPAFDLRDLRSDQSAQCDSASVGDVETCLAKAEGLGGPREYGPRAVDDHTETGAFRDPAGNLVGVYHHGQH